MIRTPAGQIRVETIAHHGHRVTLSGHHRHLRHHGLRLCQLILSAVRHIYAARADGSVKHLHQSLLGADIQILQSIQPCCFHIILFQIIGNRIQSNLIQIVVLPGRNLNCHAGLLMSAVGVQERPGQIYNFFSAPYQNQTGILCNNSHRNCLQIFLISVSQELIHVLRRNHNCHTLLRLGNRNLRAVQSGVFLWHLVQFYPQSVRQLTDGNGNAACTEIVTFFNNIGNLFPAEQSLDLSLSRRVTLLNLRTAGINRRSRMGLGRTGSAAASVTSGTTAQQNNNISRIRSQTLNRTAGSRPENCSDFHTFCHIIGMINLFYETGSKTDLISVGTVSVCCGAHKLLLRQLARHGILHRLCRIRRSGNTHSLVNISTSGKGITDRSAQTGSRTTERLNLCRMVVRLIFEINQPLFFFAVHLQGNNNRAGIDLIRLLLILQPALFFQLLHCHQGKIHQADKFIRSVFIKFCKILLILLVGLLNGLQIIALPESNLL